VQGEDFYDVWMSFNMPSSARASGTIALAAPRTPDFNISEFKIQAQITPPTDLAATAILTIVPRRDGKRLLLFELSRLLQVSSVEADGKAVEFIHNPAMEGSQLARRGNDVVAVILPAAIRARQKIQLSFKYSGAVLSEAANGLLYVGEHGTWYPNIGFAEAAFDLEFHCPIGWTLVATGRRTESRTLGAEQVSRWTSERPMPVAGFNLGKYSQTSVRAGNTTVITYATSNVERTFAGLADSNSSIGEIIGKNPALSLNSPPDDPTPARNVQIVGNTAAKALEFYQQRFGPFPYSQLALTQFPGKISQGWPGLVFLSSYAFLTGPERERFQTDPKIRLVMDQTTAHEVAHQWWGDLVSWSSYRDQWIMEALANYSALMLLESRNPAAFRELLQKFRDDLLAKDHKGQQLTDAGPVTLGIRLSSSQFPSGYEAISYGRGTWLIHMLRCMLRDGDRSKGRSKNASDDAFLSALRKLRTEYEGKAVTTPDLMSVFESVLPANLRYEGRKSLDWFYQGWVNGSSIPAFDLREVKFSNKGGATTVTGTITQEHAPESLVTAVPVYAIGEGKNTFLARVFVEGPETQFHLPAPAGTRKIVLDPERTILARTK
jgi:aminopeptidase N